MTDRPRAGPLRVFRAPNPSPLTLDGTRTYLVGARRVAVIDPGPDLPAHLDALAGAIGAGAEVTVVLTHSHPDHAAGAARLGERLAAPVRSAATGTLAEGDAVATDAGPLLALATPGHAPDHIAFHWPAARAAFVGDLMLGGQDTALVAPPEGHLGHYLASLQRIRSLGTTVLYPAHGEPFDEPADALSRYVSHRAERTRAVLAALDNGPRMLYTILDAVYGAALAEPLRDAAAGATLAYLDQLRLAGQVRRLPGGWWEKVEGAGKRGR